MVYQSFQARDQIPAGAATHTTAAAKSRALPHCAGLGIEPAPPQRRARSLTHCTTMGTPNIFFSFSFSGPACSMWKFPGRGLNLSHSSDNPEPLTTRPAGIPGHRLAF